MEREESLSFLTCVNDVETVCLLEGRVVESEVDVDGTVRGSLEELVTPELVLQPQQVDVVSQRHLAHAVGVEVELVFDYFGKVLQTRQTITSTNSSLQTYYIRTTFEDMPNPRN